MKQGLWVLAALALGILAGAWISALGRDDVSRVAQTISVLGNVWLDALRMTLVPLIFSLLVAAIAGMAETASAGRLANRALLVFAALLLGAAVYALIATNALLAVWPINPEGAAALVSGVKPEEGQEAPAALELGPWLRSLVPTNPVAAAAEGAILQIVVFACIFGFALTKLPDDKRKPVVTLFQNVGDTMIIIINWVLALAPIGVFGLALSLGLTTGLDTVGVLAQYVAVVSLVTIGLCVIALLIGVFGSGVAPLTFLRATVPVQVIAASTQSSVASLPAMLTACMGPLGIAPRVAEFVLPLAVAVFRFSSPVANLAVVIFVAHIHGMEPSLGQMVAGILVAFAVSVSSVGLPGQSSFFASIAPICLTMGVPITLLPILLAVEVIPDIFRTIGNVTADVSVTSVLAKGEKKVKDSGVDTGTASAG
jgi:proton glutamate symport protein